MAFRIRLRQRSAGRTCFRWVRDHRANDPQHGGNAGLVGRFARPRLFFQGQQLQHRQPQQGPVQFDLRDVRSAGAQFGSAIGLFERAKLELDSPATPVNETGLLGGQFLVDRECWSPGRPRRDHRESRADAAPEAVASSPHRLIGPAVDDVAPLPNHAQAFEQPHIATDAHQETVTLIEDRPPELIADKAGIATKQRECRESQLLEQRLQVGTLAGIRWPQLPAPRQPQANVPQRGSTTFAAPQLGDHSDSWSGCLGRLRWACRPRLLVRDFFLPRGFLGLLNRSSLGWVRGTLTREPSTANGSHFPTRQAAGPTSRIKLCSRAHNAGSSWGV